MSSEPDGSAVVLCDVREEPLSVDEVLAAVRHPQCGGIALFVGVVRDHDHGTEVAALDYSAHPSAVDTLRQVCDEVAARHGVARLAAVHRTGHLEVGDMAVVVAVAAAHRGEAFDGLPRPDRHPQVHGPDLEAPALRRRLRRVGGAAVSRTAHARRPRPGPSSTPPRPTPTGSPGARSSR